MLRQLYALLWLKYKSFMGKGSASRIITMVVYGAIATGGILAVIASSAGGFYLGTLMEAPGTSTANSGGVENTDLILGLDIAVFVFLFMWLFGLMLELQRQDSIDLRSLLYMPVSLRMAFGLNYLVSLLSIGTIILLPGLMAFALGLVTSHGPIALLLLPGILLFFLMFGAWAFYIRGLVAIIMENKRRRRTFLTLLPIAFVLLGQLPNILLSLGNQRFFAPALKWIEPFLADESIIINLHLLLPPGWLPYGVVQILDGNVFHGLAAFAGLGLFTLWGLSLGYRSTLRYYMEGGDNGNEKGKKKKTKKPTTPKRPLTERGLPGLADDTAALTWASFLSYQRQPNIRMLLLMPIIMGIVFLMIFSNPDIPFTGHSGTWMPFIVLLWPFLNFSTVFTNLFGFDTVGFRGTVLLPTARSKVLLAKNLGLFPFVGAICLIMIAMGALLFEIHPKSAAISLIQVPQLFFLYCIMGNILSIYFPLQVNRNTLRMQGNRAMMFLLNMLSLPLLGILSIPTLICFNADALAEYYGYGALPWGLLLSGIFLGLILLVYRYSLIHTGDLLLVKEQKILLTLMKEQG